MGRLATDGPQGRSFGMLGWLFDYHLHHNCYPSAEKGALSSRSCWASSSTTPSSSVGGSPISPTSSSAVPFSGNSLCPPFTSQPIREIAIRVMDAPFEIPFGPNLKPGFGQDAPWIRSRCPGLRCPSWAQLESWIRPRCLSWAQLPNLKPGFWIRPRRPS